MALTKTWSATVSNGQQTQIQIDGTKVDSARVRWNGIDRYEAHSWVGHGEKTFPTPPTGYTITYGACGAVVYVRTYSMVGTTLRFTLSAPGGTKREYIFFPSDGEYECEIWTTCSGTGTVTLGISVEDEFGPAEYHTVSYWTYVEAKRGQFLGGTDYPKITVGTQTISGPANVPDGQWSNWYNVTLSPGLNRITHSIGGGGQAICEIEYTCLLYTSRCV